MNILEYIDFNTIVGLLACIMIIVFGLVVFFRFSMELSAKRYSYKNEKIMLLNLINDRLINLNDDIKFILDLESDTMLHSHNMEERLGWTFPDRMKERFMDDPKKYWQIWDGDIVKLKKIFSDALDGKASEELIGVLSANLDYPVYRVSLYPIQNRKNETTYIVGTLTKDMH